MDLAPAQPAALSNGTFVQDLAETIESHIYQIQRENLPVGQEIIFEGKLDSPTTNDSSGVNLENLLTLEMKGRDRQGNNFESIDQMWSSVLSDSSKNYFDQVKNGTLDGALKDQTDWYAHVKQYWDA